MRAPRRTLLLFVSVGLVGTVLQPATSVRGATQTFSNAAPITIPKAGNGSPFPSQIAVSGIDSATKVTVTIHGYSHQTPSTAWLILAGPTGRKVGLMHGSGGTTDVNNLTITFDNDGVAQPDGGNPITSGTYKPRPGAALDNTVCNIPVGTTMSNVNVAGQLNGTWSLCAYGNNGFDDGSGSISGGWSLNFETGGGGGSCEAESAPARTAADPEPECDWVVTFDLVQDGYVPGKQDVSTYTETETTAQGRLLFDKRPKRGRVARATLLSLGFSQIDFFDDGEVFSEFYELAALNATLKLGENTVLKLPAFLTDGDACSSLPADVGKVTIVDGATRAGRLIRDEEVRL